MSVRGELLWGGGGGGGGGSASGRVGRELDIGVLRLLASLLLVMRRSSFLLRLPYLVRVRNRVCLKPSRDSIATLFQIY